MLYKVSILLKDFFPFVIQLPFVWYIKFIYHICLYEWQNVNKYFHYNKKTNIDIWKWMKVPKFDKKINFFFPNWESVLGSVWLNFISLWKSEHLIWFRSKCCAFETWKREQSLSWKVCACRQGLIPTFNCNVRQISEVIEKVFCWKTKGRLWLPAYETNEAYCLSISSNYNDNLVDMQ